MALVPFLHGVLIMTPEQEMKTNISLHHVIHITWHQ